MGFGTLAFGMLVAIALGQQVDMWLAIARPNLLRYRSANFTYPRNVSCQRRGGKFK
ncbi:MAG: hypothetical protein J7L30_02105 [Methanophagales archaeon]|nr:hypothetical protein [Methanophagales archaeon]